MSTVTINRLQDIDNLAHVEIHTRDLEGVGIAPTYEKAVAAAVEALLGDIEDVKHNQIQEAYDEGMEDGRYSCDCDCDQCN